MSPSSLVQQENMDRSLILSYGGGGNYGDELLLEVLLNMFYQSGRTSIQVGYLQPSLYPTYHHDFGYKLVTTKHPIQLLKSIFVSKNIVVGGGGLWGMDVNPSVFIMSAMLWVCRWILGKKIYLLAVGYYDSTNRPGHIAAWLAAKSATTIIARDEETYTNFRRFTTNVLPGQDLAWCSQEIDLSAYQKDLADLQDRFSLSNKTIFVTLRRFKAKYRNDFNKRVQELIANNPKKQIVIGLMEPRQVDPEGFALITAWAQKFAHVRAIDFSYNPLALLLFFKHHKDSLIYVGPQFHGLVSAHLAGVPFMPLVYDNKSRALLEQIGGSPPISVYDLKPGQLQAFVDGAVGA